MGARGCLGYTLGSSGMVTHKWWEPNASKIQTLDKLGLPPLPPSSGLPNMDPTFGAIGPPQCLPHVRGKLQRPL